MNNTEGQPQKQKLSLYVAAVQSEDGTIQKRSVQLINPGSIVEKVFYTKDSVVCGVITSGNVDRVVFYSGMGKFILHRET